MSIITSQPSTELNQDTTDSGAWRRRTVPPTPSRSRARSSQMNRTFTSQTWAHLDELVRRFETSYADSRSKEKREKPRCGHSVSAPSSSALQRSLDLA